MDGVLPTRPKRHFSAANCRTAKDSFTFGRPLPTSLAGGAGARPNHPTTGHAHSPDTGYENQIDDLWELSNGGSMPMRTVLGILLRFGI